MSFAGTLRRSATDEELSRRVAGGDRDAFDELHDRYRAPLVRYCRSLLGDPHEAHDAVQEAMLKALTALEHADEPPRAPKAWLFRIAHNEAITLVRRRRPSAPEAELELLCVAGPEADAARLGLQAAEDGRETSCSTIRRQISDGDGRRLRRRGLRAHVRSCRGCAEFETALHRCRDDFALVGPGWYTAAAAVAAGFAGLVLTKKTATGWSVAKTTAVLATVATLGTTTVVGRSALPLVGEAHHEQVQTATSRPTPLQSVRPRSSARLVPGTDWAAFRVRTIVGRAPVKERGTSKRAVTAAVTTTTSKSATRTATLRRISKKSVRTTAPTPATTTVAQTSAPATPAPSPGATALAAAIKTQQERVKAEVTKAVTRVQTSVKAQIEQATSQLQGAAQVLQALEERAATRHNQTSP